MRIGQLDQRVTIETPTEVQDQHGGTGTTWSDKATVWASITGESGGEVQEGGKTRARARYTVKIRYRDDLTTKDRIRHRGRVLEIESMPDVHQRKDTLELVCVETQIEPQT
jgi:SPP1 family predicted phage head-tail adaptor